jgi:pimeloyl-ACP methyl ester carboxylesterase
MRRRVDAPVLVIWGEQDRFLGRALADPDPRRVPNAVVKRLPTAGHWVQLDEPDRVNELLVDFLTPVRDATSRSGADARDDLPG